MTSIQNHTPEPHSNVLRLPPECRVVIHMDMDSFYVAVERSRFPSWPDKSVCVVQGGSLVVSSSHHTRIRGLPKMGRCEIFDVLCPSDEHLDDRVRFSASDMRRFVNIDCTDVTDAGS